MQKLFTVSVAAAVFAVILTQGCALRSYRSEASPPVEHVLTIYETQVTLGSCLFKTQQEVVLAPIAAALASSAISQSVSYLGNALNEAAKETNDKSVASRNVELTAKTFGPCVQIVRGWFYRGFKDEGESERELKRVLGAAVQGDRGPLGENDVKRLWLRRMWPAAQPDFVFEGQVVMSSVQKPDSRALAWAPVFVRLDQPVSRAWLRPGSARHVAVFLAFHEVNSEASAPNASGAGSMVLGKLDPGVEKRFPPTISDTEKQPNRHPSESKWFTLVLGEQKKPMTVTALVTEHQDAQPFLQFLGAVFGGASATITDTLQKGFVSSKRDQVEESEKAQAEVANTAYDEAFSKAVAAAKTCSGSISDAVAASTDVRTKLRSLNKAARAIGKDQFAETVPLTADVKLVQKECTTLHQTLTAAL